MSTEIYWASKEPKEFVLEIHKRIEDFYSDLRETNIFYLLQRSFTAYFGGDLTNRGTGNLFDSSKLGRGGKQGEIVHLKTNHYRNLVKHSLQLATNQKPAITCKATNSDYKSQAQTILANGILDYYMREKKLAQKYTAAVEKALTLAEGWIHAPWDSEMGEVIDVNPETGAPIHEGDLNFDVLNISDVVRDINLNDNKHQWLCCRTYRNRFDLAAQYPELSDDILRQKDDKFDYEKWESFDFNIKRNAREYNDILPYWTFYHEKSKSMPQGRMVQFVGDVILYDGPIPYRDIPLYQCSPDMILNSPYGYSPAFEILAPQQAIDILTSTIMTNNAANGVQNIWSQKGDDLSVRSLSGGMKHIQSMEMPQPLQLTATAAETYRFRENMIAEMETLVGISSTVRGNPEASLKSGSALALVVSQSIQFASLLEASYQTMIENVSQGIINQIRDFSKSKRIAYIIGEANRPFQREFTADDLSLVNRVTCEPVNPLSKTTSGRVEIANNMLEKGMIENPQQYMQVLTTGTLDPAIEGVNHENLNIRAENEDLRDGSKEPVAIITDNHPSHILEHKNVLATPEARMDPGVVERTLAHIQEHLDLWRNMDQALLMLLKLPPPPPSNGQNIMQEQQPMPESMQPPMPQGQMPMPPQPGPIPPPPGPTDAAGMPGNAPNQPNMPSMPNLPPNAPPETQQAYDQLA